MDGENSVWVLVLGLLLLFLGLFVGYAIGINDSKDTSDEQYNKCITMGIEKEVCYLESFN